MQLQLGMRVKLVRGDKNYYGIGKDSDHGEWIAGRIPVGSTGTICLAKNHYPNSVKGYSDESYGPFCIIWDHNPIPVRDFYWGVTLNQQYNNLILYKDLEVLDS